MKTGKEKGSEETLKRIGKKLKDLRIKHSYSSYETFAIENDLDRKQYWRMEDGSNITMKSLIKVLNIHGVSLREFFKDF